MSELTESDKNLLQHIQGGGLVGIAVYGKRTKIMEILCSRTCIDAGIKRIDILREAGLVRYGDPSPDKSGRITPIVLTDAGEAVVGA